MNDRSVLTASHDDVTMSDIVAAHLDWMKGERYSERSISERGKFLRMLERRLPHGLDDVWVTDLEAFQNTAGWSPWTRHSYHSHMVGFYRWAAADGWLSCDPTETIPTPPSGQSRPKPITRAEVRIILTRSEDPWLTASMLALLAGLRASEIADIRRQDIDPEYVHVVRGKGGRERWVETSATLWRFVKNRPAGPLVRRPYGRGCVTGRWLSSHQQIHWRSIGLPHVHLHRLRHTFCTEMLAAGHDALALRDLMGHSSVLTTQGYAQVGADQRRRAIASLDALMGAGAEV